MRQVLLFLWLFTFSTIAYGQEHPRLFFDNEDIPALRAKKTQEPFNAILSEVYKQFHADTLSRFDHPYNMSKGAALAGFLYVLTDSVHYAELARDYVRHRILDDSTNNAWAKTNVKGLALYWHATYISFAYDFCYNEWPVAFRDTVSKALLQQANVIASHGGTEQNTNPASNWQGIRGSAASLCYLATDESYDQALFSSMTNKVKRYIHENYGARVNNAGWNIEGLGYTYYPTGNFIGPFAIAIERACPTCNLRKHNGFINSYWSIYASLSNAKQLHMFKAVRPDFGDDNPHVSGEGVFGQSFYFLPEELLPEAKYWYDQIIATRDTLPYDNYRFGAVWSYLYYPDNIEAKNPMDNHAWKRLFLDYEGNGYFTYRNQYQDSTDIIAQMHQKFRGNKGHNGPDALSFRIIGNGTAWAVGGGRYGPKINNDIPELKQDVYLCNMNTLYPHDPELKINTNGNSGSLVAHPLLLDNGDGHVIAEIEENNVGVMNHKRWFVADFDFLATGTPATFIIGDQSDDGLFWQFNTYEHNTITADSNVFIVTAKNGTSLKGTILYPASDFNYTIGKRLRGSMYGFESDSNTYLHFQSSDGDYLVVLTIAEAGQEHPVISSTTQGVLYNTIQVGGKSFELTSENVRYNGVEIIGSPTASFSVDRTAGQAPLRITLDATQSKDPLGQDLHYQWLLDGETTIGDEMIIQHTFSEEGSYTPKLVVSDNFGNTDTTQIQVFVYNHSHLDNFSPECLLISPANNSDFNQFDSIPVAVTAFDFDGYIDRITFSDGTGVFDVDSVYPFSGMWIPQAGGTYYLTATAYDNMGASRVSNTRTVHIHTVSEAPSILASHEDIIIYPNPTTDVIHLPLCFEKCVIYNELGRIVTSLPHGEKQYNLGSHGKGLYLIQVFTKEKIFTQRIVVQ